MGIRTTFNSMGGVKIASGVAKIAMGYFSNVWYLTSSGDLYGTGENSRGNQGSGNTSDVLTFTKRASNVIDVCCSYANTYYIDKNNDLYGCGSNGYYQLGTGNQTTLTTFTKLASNVAKVYCSISDNGVTWYIATNGDLYGCGSNTYGQQGNGSSGGGQYVTTFTKRASNVEQVFCSHITTWYINSSGDLYGCGSGSQGQQGNNSTGTFGQVTTFTKRASNVISGDCSTLTTWYINSSGDLYGCGSGQYGQQGNYSSGSGISVMTFTKRASNVEQVSSSRNETWYINSSGDLYGCGYNTYNQQGSGSNTDITVFTKRGTNALLKKEPTDSTGINNMYLTSDGDLYAAGHFSSGAAGNGTDSNTFSTFTKIASDVVDYVYCGDMTYYLTSSGDLYGTGIGGNGQQGNGSTSNVLTFQNKMQYLTT